MSSDLGELKTRAEVALRRTITRARTENARHPSAAEVEHIRAIVHEAYEAGREHERRAQAEGFSNMITGREKD